MKKGGMWGIAMVMLGCLSGCDYASHRALRTSTVVTTVAPSGALATASSPCPAEQVVWQGTLNEDNSLLALCTVPVVDKDQDVPTGVYRLYRRYTDGTTTHTEAASYDVGLTPRSVGGGFWLRTDTQYHQVAEGSETAIYELDEQVAFQGFLPKFISGVTMNDGRHMNRTRDHFVTP